MDRSPNSELLAEPDQALRGEIKRLTFTTSDQETCDDEIEVNACFKALTIFPHAQSNDVKLVLEIAKLFHIKKVGT